MMQSTNVVFHCPTNYLRESLQTLHETYHPDSSRIPLSIQWIIIPYLLSFAQINTSMGELLYYIEAITVIPLLFVPNLAALF